MSTKERIKPADTHLVDMGKLVSNLAEIVEKETEAFQLLLSALLDQQANIIKGDTDAVTASNEKVEQLMAETRVLGKQRIGETQSLGQRLHPDDDEKLSLSQVIPLVEDRYARRLGELREILVMLMKKIQKTNERNRFLLSNSLDFVDNCMRLLMQNQQKANAYSRHGVMDTPQESMFSGVG
ncbi:flagellar protein FlgN [bacterium]|nr:flagellar protein FlgN [bacterium]